MGGGISTEGDLGQMIACTMMLGEAMFHGMDPRYVRFPGNTYEVASTSHADHSMMNAYYNRPIKDESSDRGFHPI
jgi:hypothetical protein